MSTPAVSYLVTRSTFHLIQAARLEAEAAIGENWTLPLHPPTLGKLDQDKLQNSRLQLPEIVTLVPAALAALTSAGKPYSTSSANVLVMAINVYFVGTN